LWTLAEGRRGEVAREPDEEIRETAEPATQEPDVHEAEAEVGGGGTVRNRVPDPDPLRRTGLVVTRAGSARP
jgi:hypothetical protein